MILETITEGLRTAFRNGKNNIDILALRQRQEDLSRLIGNLAELAFSQRESAEDFDKQFREYREEQESIVAVLKENEQECMAEECENSRLENIIRTIQETADSLPRPLVGLPPSSASVVASITPAIMGRIYRKAIRIQRALR